MERLLVVPAGGLGTRLGTPTPKLLVPVNGRPMIEHLLALYAPIAQGAVVVVHPSANARVRERLPREIDVVVQPAPTGMLDAILVAVPVVERRRPRRVLITWCDQVGIHPKTVARMAAATSAPEDPALALLTCVRTDPYIHFERDAAGRIVRVLQRREGDAMPPRGESDAGVFDLSLNAYLGALREYAGGVETGAGTGERNFLPFIPWLAQRERVVAVPVTAVEESVGVNTPEELAFIERYLKERAAADV